MKLYTDTSKPGWGFWAKDAQGNVWSSSTTTYYHPVTGQLVQETYWWPVPSVGRAAAA